MFSRCTPTTLGTQTQWLPRGLGAHSCSPGLRRARLGEALAPRRSSRCCCSAPKPGDRPAKASGRRTSSLSFVPRPRNRCVLVLGECIVQSRIVTTAGTGGRRRTATAGQNFLRIHPQRVSVGTASPFSDCRVRQEGASSETHSATHCVAKPCPRPHVGHETHCLTRSTPMPLFLGQRDGWPLSPLGEFTHERTGICSFQLCQDRKRPQSASSN